METDIIQLGKEQKGGKGLASLNKAYLQYVGRRNGKIIVELFANPKGGSERMSQIKPLLDLHIIDGTILLTDGCRGGKAYIMDNPHKNILHLIVNHSKASSDGFTWYCYVDEDDGKYFEHLTDGEYRLIEVSTQNADGFGGILKMWLNNKRGHTRENIKGYIKEFQFRQNNSDQDIFYKFLSIWGEIETSLRQNLIEISDLDELLKWDFSAYVDYDFQNFVPSWECPGCDFITSGNDWRKGRTSHKKKCPFYQTISSRSYAHENSRCFCCIIPYHESSFKKKRKAINPPKSKKRKKAKNKKCKLFACPSCDRTVSDTPASRWQHRSRNPDCALFYQKLKS